MIGYIFEPSELVGFKILVRNIIFDVLNFCLFFRWLLGTFLLKTEYIFLKTEFSRKKAVFSFHNLLRR